MLTSIELEIRLITGVTGKRESGKRRGIGDKRCVVHACIIHTCVQHVCARVCMCMYMPANG